MDLSVQEIANRVYEQRASTWTSTMLVLMFFLVAFYVKAMFNQQAVISIFEQDIDTDNREIRMQAYMLGALLNPQRIALICEYPMMYSWLGYTSPYTGPVVRALTELEPSIERVVMALTLLESGLVVSQDGKTVPPTLFQEVLRQVYPTDDYKPPVVIKPASIPKKAVNTFDQVMPWAMQGLMLVAMLA